MKVKKSASLVLTAIIVMLNLNAGFAGESEIFYNKTDILEETAENLPYTEDIFNEKENTEISLAATGTPYAVEGGNIYYNPSTGTITGSDESVVSAVIPGEIDGVKITSVGEDAFYINKNLTSVVISEGITSVDDHAFYRCSALTNVTLPNSLASIGYNAFGSTEKLTSLQLPPNVSSIGSRAFYNSGITDIKIPAATETIGGGAFHVQNLNSITVDENNMSFVIADGVLFDKDKTRILKYNPKIETASYSVPETVTLIDDYAFGKCKNLENVILPNGLEIIGPYAFVSCSNLKEMVIPRSVTSIYADSFTLCHNMTGITVDDNNSVYTSIDGAVFSKDKKELLIYPCLKETSYAIPNGTVKIGEHAFMNNPNLSEIIIPNGVTNIGEYAFSSAKKLTNIVIPDSVTSIEACAFIRCTSLTSITIPNSVTAINDSTFAYCEKLTNVIIPDSVTSIGYAAFRECSSLESITIPDSVAKIGTYTFNGCTSLASITIPDSVTSIGNNAFNGCTSLTSITIPDSVTSIGSNAFYGCGSLVIHCNAGSYAEIFAQKNNISHKIIGYNSPDIRPLQNHNFYYDENGNETEIFDYSEVPGYPTSIEVRPSHDQLKERMIFYVDFYINSTGFGAYAFEVSYNTEVLIPITGQLEGMNSAAEIRYYDEYTGTYKPVINNALINRKLEEEEKQKTGVIQFTDLIMINGEPANIEGKGTLFRLYFYAASEGSSAINIKGYGGNFILNSSSKNIPVYVENSSVLVKNDVPVTGVILDKTKAEVVKGASIQLNAEIIPEDAKGSVDWESSDDKIAKVSYGRVEGISEGTAVITAKAGRYSAQCTVDVKSNDKVYYDGNGNLSAVDSIPNEAACIEAVPLKTSVKEGEEFYVDFKIKNNPGFERVSFYVNYNPDIIVPIAGNVDEMDNAVEVKYEFDSNVYKPLFEASDINYKIEKSNGSIWFTADYFKTSNGDTAVVTDNGTMFRIKFKSVGEGTSNIWVNGSFYDGSGYPLGNTPVYAQSGLVESKVIRVTDITLNRTEAEMAVGTFITLLANMLPEDAPKENIVWSSSDPSVAYISDNGVVLAYKQGTAVIMAETESGRASAQCTITVVKQTSSSQYEDGDVDRDGYITAKDAAYVLKKALDSSFEYPVQ